MSTCSPATWSQVIMKGTVFCPYWNKDSRYCLPSLHWVFLPQLSSMDLRKALITVMLLHTSLLLIKEFILQLKKKKVRLWLWSSLVLTFIPSSEILSRVVSFKVTYSKLMRNTENGTQLLGNKVAGIKWESGVWLLIRAQNIDVFCSDNIRTQKPWAPARRDAGGYLASFHQRFLGWNPRFQDCSQWANT